MREEIQMKNAVSVIESFANREPLSRHLRNFFRTHRNIGSTDRKILSSLVYGYYRIKGNSERNNDVREILLYASRQNDLLKMFHTYWSQHYADPQIPNVDDPKYFPLSDRISSLVNKNEFLASHLHQPRVWIRAVPGSFDQVAGELNQLGYKWDHIDTGTIAFDANYPLDQLNGYKTGKFEIQDISSQMTQVLFQPAKNELWWDCCAGSGGKSILLLEKESRVQLFVSDIRGSILDNLKERLNRKGIQNFTSFIADLRDPQEVKNLPPFDGIIADLPCSGSGTWSRTPEWLSYFEESLLDQYTALQKSILSTVIARLKSGGKLIFLTCSVYADENEENVKWMIEHGRLKCDQMRYFQHSSEGGDTMFGAVMIKE